MTAMQERIFNKHTDSFEGSPFHINKKAPLQDAFLAEQVGFEPTGPEGLTDFESASL